MLRIKLNGEQKTLDEQDSLQGALSLWGYEQGGFAVAINGEFGPRHHYSEARLQDGDEVEIVAPMQGG